MSTTDPSSRRFGGRPGKRHALPLLERYSIDGNGCWIWQGAMTTSGYAACSWQGRMTHAHRVFYEHHCHPIPAGMHIDHLCRNRACVNPAHLESVTPAENARRRPTSKVTHEDVAEIRAITDELCKKYGITPAALAHIVRRTRWSDEA